MAVESIIDLKVKYSSDVKKGVEETSKSLDKLSRSFKDVGDIGMGAFGPMPDRIGKTVKGLAGMASALGPVGLAVGAIGVAFGAALLSASKFFDNALSRSPELSKNWEEIKNRVKAIFNAITDFLMPAFTALVDLGLRLLPQLGQQFDDVKKNVDGVTKSTNEWLSATRDATEAMGILAAKRAGDQKRELEVRHKAQKDALEAEIANTVRAADQEVNGKKVASLGILNTEDEKRKALKAKQDAEMMDLEQKLAKEAEAKQKALDDEEQARIDNQAAVDKLMEDRYMKEVMFRERLKKENAKANKDEVKAHYAKVLAEIEADKKLKAEKIQMYQTIGTNAANLSGMLAQLVTSGNKVSRKEAMIAKGLNIGQAVINTAVGVTEALKGPYPLNLVNAALVGAMGAVQVGIISQQKFAKGGMIGGGQQSITVNEQGQEAVLNADATRRLGRQGVDDLNAGRGLGGIVINSPVMINGTNLSAKALSKLLRSRDDELLRAFRAAQEDANYRGVSR